MPEDLRPETIAAITGFSKKGRPTITEVKQQAEDMNVIDQSIDTARKLSGAPALEEEIDRKDKKLERVEQERDKAIEDKHKTEIESVKTELGAKIDGLVKSYAGGASKDSIAEQIIEIKKAANELNMGGTRISEIRDMLSLITTLNPHKSLADQIKDAKELITVFTPPPDKGKEFNIGGMPASVALELKKMDTTLQITLEKMKDDRQRQDQEFQLSLKKWDEEREIRRQEIDGKILVERERNEVVSGALRTVGGAIGKGLADRGGAAMLGSTPAPRAYGMEIPLGETGTIACPNCQSPIGVGPTQTSTQCIKCNTKYPITRLPPAQQRVTADILPGTDIPASGLSEEE
jgi:hypothetical protein